MRPSFDGFFSGFPRRLVPGLSIEPHAPSSAWPPHAKPGGSRARMISERFSAPAKITSPPTSGSGAGFDLGESSRQRSEAMGGMRALAGFGFGPPRKRSGAQSTRVRWRGTSAVLCSLSIPGLLPGGFGDGEPSIAWTRDGDGDQVFLAIFSGQVRVRAGRDSTIFQFAAWFETFSDGPGRLGVSSSAAGAFPVGYHSSHCAFQSDALVPSKNFFDVRTKWQVFPSQSGGGP